MKIYGSSEKMSKLMNDMCKYYGILSEKDARDKTVTFRLTIDKAEKLAKEIIKRGKLRKRVGIVACPDPFIDCVILEVRL